MDETEPTCDHTPEVVAYVRSMVQLTAFAMKDPGTLRAMEAAGPCLACTFGQAMLAIWGTPGGVDVVTAAGAQAITRIHGEAPEPPGVEWTPMPLDGWPSDGWPAKVPEAVEAEIDDEPIPGPSDPRWRAVACEEAEDPVLAGPWLARTDGVRLRLHLCPGCLGSGLGASPDCYCFGSGVIVQTHRDERWGPRRPPTEAERRRPILRDWGPFGPVLPGDIESAVARRQGT